MKTLFALCLMACHLSVSAESIHFLIPGTAGGGWDRTARTVGQVLVDTQLLQSARFENLAGGGGGKAIAHLIELDQPNMLMVNSTPIVVRSLQGIFPQSFRDLQPVASLIGDYSVIAVRSASAISTLNELFALQQADPHKHAIAGGSVRGSTDHIVAAMMARGYGADPNSVKYIPYDTGAKAMVGLLSGEVVALSSGFGEVIDLVEQGWVRVLCVASNERLEQLADAPTCQEAGARGAYFVNWRGFFAPPSVDAATIAQWHEMFAELVNTPEWLAARERYGWVDLFNIEEDFVHLLTNQEATLRSLLTEMDLL